jgi:hypothetical protein
MEHGGLSECRLQDIEILFPVTGRAVVDIRSGSVGNISSLARSILQQTAIFTSGAHAGLLFGSLFPGDVAVDADHVQRSSVPVAFGDAALAAYQNEITVVFFHPVHDFV